MTIITALMALADPQVPWDVGFQLSFAATLVLMLFAHSMQDAFSNWLSRRISETTAKKVAAPVGEYLLFTLAAQFTTLPIMAYPYLRAFHGWRSWPTPRFYRPSRRL